MSEVVVVGAGAIGLSCALCLLEAGLEVRVLAERRTPHTTSDRSGAVFYPLEIEPERDRVLRWSRGSLARFTRLAEDPDSGVTWVEFHEYFPERSDAPWWVDVGVETRRSDEVPAGYGDAWVTRVPCIDMPVYLPFLERCIAEVGGTIEERRVDSLTEVGSDVVVNCTGLGARELCGDSDVRPLRGQAVLVPWTSELRAALGHGIIDDEGPNAVAYVVPRSGGLVLGGTMDDGSASESIDEAQTESILRRCAALAPVLGGAHGEAWVGLRPGRSRVRLEVERQGSTAVVHDYGHGPLGVTRSWGCAAEVVDHVRLL